MSNVLDKDGLLRVIRSILDPEVDALTWGHDPDVFVSRGKVTLTVTRMSSLGVDEHRPTLSDGTDGYPVGTWWVNEIGNRDILINVRAEAFDKSVEAAEVIDTIRTRLRAESTRDQLNALNLALVEMMPAINLPTTYDNRLVSVATADLKLAGIAQFVSVKLPPTAGGDYIATVNGDNTIPGAYGGP